MRSTTKKTEQFTEAEKFWIRMQKEHILQKLKNEGYRVTKPRIAVIDIILERDCGSCKEIIYWISKMNKSIGTATIYRTLNMLEEIGAINRRSSYHVSAVENENSGIIVLLENGEEIHLDAEEWNEVMQKGLETCGYLKGEKILSIRKKQMNSV